MEIREEGARHRIESEREREREPARTREREREWRRWVGRATGQLEEIRNGNCRRRCWWEERQSGLIGQRKRYSEQTVESRAGGAGEWAARHKSRRIFATLSVGSQFGLVAEERGRRPVTPIDATDNCGGAWWKPSTGPCPDRLLASFRGSRTRGTIFPPPLQVQ